MAPPRMDCHFSWELESVLGVDVLPPPTRQPERNFCGAHVTVECFEARARLICAEFGETFPTLSIQHMIDMLKDELAAANTLHEKRLVMEEDYTFKLLIARGVTSKADYDAAPRRPGYFMRNVEGVHHYRIRAYTTHFMNKSAWHESGCSSILDGIQDDGPVYGWFVYHPSFQTTEATGKIFRVPKEQVEEEEDMNSSDANSSSSLDSAESSSDSYFDNDDDDDDDDDDTPPAEPMLNLDLPKTHAILIFGFGSRGKLGLLDYQNNWGTEKSRGVMEARNNLSHFTSSGLAEFVWTWPLGSWSKE